MLCLTDESLLLNRSCWGVFKRRQKPIPCTVPKNMMVFKKKLPCVCSMVKTWVSQHTSIMCTVVISILSSVTHCKYRITNFTYIYRTCSASILNTWDLHVFSILHMVFCLQLLNQSCDLFAESFFTFFPSD
jgi:hypothetical protein